MHSKLIYVFNMLTFNKISIISNKFDFLGKVAKWLWSRDFSAHIGEILKFSTSYLSYRLLCVTEI